MASDAAEPDMQATSELIRGLIDDSSLASAVLQSLTSMRSALETGSTSAESSVTIEAAQSHGSQQNLCHRLRQRAADAQRAQLAVARSMEREAGLRKKLEVAERSNTLLHDEAEVAAGKLRALQAALAELNAKEVDLHELNRLTAAMRERDQQLLEERELTTQLRQALHAAAIDRDRQSQPGAHAAAAEAAAMAALSRANAVDSERSKQLAAEAMRSRREASVDFETLRVDLSRCDAELCASRVDGQALTAALDAARARLELECTARARAEEELVAARRQCERLAAELGAAQEQVGVHARSSREREAEKRRLVTAAAHESDTHRASLLAETTARRAASNQLEEAERLLAGTKAELEFANQAVEKMRSETRSELTAMHEECAASAKAHAADRAALLAELASAQRERREQAEALSELRLRAASAASLDSMMPHVTKLIRALEQREDDVSSERFAVANAAAMQSAAAAAAAANEGRVGKPATEVEAAVEVEVEAELRRHADAELLWRSGGGGQGGRFGNVSGGGGGGARIRELAGDAAHSAARAEELRREVMTLKDEVCNLQLELASRPPVRAVRELSAKVQELEAALHDERRRRREPLWPVQHAVRHGSPTREAIKRDKEIARMGGIEGLGGGGGGGGGGVAAPSSAAEQGLISRAEAGVGIEPADDVGDIGEGTMSSDEQTALLVDVCRMLGVRSLHAIRDQLRRAIDTYNDAPVRRRPPIRPSSARGRRPSSAAAAAATGKAGVSSAAAASGGGGGLSASGLASVLIDLVGGKDEGTALQRVRHLVALEADTEAKSCEIALSLGMSPDAPLAQCAAKLRADEARRAESTELVDAASARELLLKLRAHDGPSALKALEAMELKGAEYRKILGRFQQQMGAFAAQVGGGALRQASARAAGVAAGAGGASSPGGATAGRSAGGAGILGRAGGVGGAGGRVGGPSTWQSGPGGTVRPAPIGRGRGTRYAAGSAPR